MAIDAIGATAALLDSRVLLGSAAGAATLHLHSVDCG